MFRHRIVELRYRNMQNFYTCHELYCMVCILFYFIHCIRWLMKCNLNAYLICNTCNISKYENSLCINIKWLSEHSHRHRDFWLCLYLPGLEPTHLTSVSTFLWGYFLKRTHLYVHLYTLTFVSDGLWFISNLPILCIPSYVWFVTVLATQWIFCSVQ